MKTIGVLGGMGPEATGRFFDLLIRNTAADRDQDHVPVLIFSCPQIPDRTEGLVGDGPSPLPELIKGAMALQAGGADFGVIPCITAHYFYADLVASSSLPFLSLVSEAVEYVRRERSEVRNIGLLATIGTLRSRILEDPFRSAGLAVTISCPAEQDEFMEAVHDIKRGAGVENARSVMAGMADKLIGRGAEAVLAGCTEVPLALGAEDLRVPFIDPMLIAARECIARAGGKLR
ncbi:MAG: amino acid racemase [Acidobacteria bacterium]|nr:MAG: amino acid racemase [Acidobacteriota bacterium]